MMIDKVLKATTSPARSKTTAIVPEAISSCNYNFKIVAYQNSCKDTFKAPDKSPLSSTISCPAMDKIISSPSLASLAIWAEIPITNRTTMLLMTVKMALEMFRTVNVTAENQYHLGQPT